MPGNRKLAWGEKWVLSEFRRLMQGVPVRIVLWNGEEISPSAGSPVASVFVPDFRALVGLICNPEVYFGEGYASGRIRVEGDLVAMLESAFRWADGVPSRLRDRRVRAKTREAGALSLLGFWGRLGSSFLGWLQANSLRGSRRNIHHHYDIGNDFYKLWLDSQLVYTCAYFPSPQSSLEEAQLAKMDHVCRKLQLRPGETVVEAGCGWGALALHMARHYGVSVKAFNISRRQIDYARRRAQLAGLSDRVEFIEDDYRNITGRFDVFVSVGMLEHVGLRHYRELGRVIRRCLDDSGRGLLHFIGRNWPRPLSAWIRRRIFPGAYPPTLREALTILEPWDFSILDVENIRLHYARTLEHWLERFEQSADLVSEMFDERFVRIWRLYLAGSLTAFRAGSLQLFQLTFAGSACKRIPWTRASLYQTAGVGQPVGFDTTGLRPVAPEL